MGAFSDIYGALCSKVEDAFPDVDIAWENIDYEPLESSTFVQPFLGTAHTRQGLGQDALIEHYGLFHLVINVPNGTSSVAARDLADYANTVYYRGATISFGDVDVLVEGFDFSSPLLMTQKAWAQLPCSVRWRCHVPSIVPN